MAKLTLDNGKYEVVGNFGCWARSNERVDLGTVRYIGNRLMYAYNVNTRFGIWRSTYSTSWVAVPIEGTMFSTDDIRNWKKEMLDNG